MEAPVQGGSTSFHVTRCLASRERDATEAVDDAEKSKSEKKDAFNAAAKTVLDTADKLEQVRTTNSAVVQAVEKASIDAKLAAQNADYAETKVQERQVEHEDATKALTQAQDNLAKQEANQKEVAEMHELAREKDRQEAVQAGCGLAE